MSLYAIGDLHFSTLVEKPMNIFGDKWDKHEEKIISSWKDNVKDEDVVLVLGDTSWGINLTEAKPDLDIISNLCGNKIFIKGNHDYWWTTLTSMRKFLKKNKFENIDFIYNTAYEFENYILAGTRGWGQNEEGEDKKLLKRETIRLELSLQKALELQKKSNKEIIVFLHYPPIISNNIINNEMSDFIKIMKQYNIKKCYYGHLHSTAIREAVEGEHYGIKFKLVSADGLDFKLLKIGEN